VSVPKYFRIMYGGLKQRSKKCDGIWEILPRHPLLLPTTSKPSHLPLETLRDAPLHLSGHGLGKKRLMRLIGSVFCSSVLRLWPGLASHGSGWHVSEWRGWDRRGPDVAPARRRFPALPVNLFSSSFRASSASFSRCFWAFKTSPSSILFFAASLASSRRAFSAAHCAAFTAFVGDFALNIVSSEIPPPLHFDSLSANNCGAAS